MMYSDDLIHKAYAGLCKLAESCTSIVVRNYNKGNVFAVVDAANRWWAVCMPNAITTFHHASMSENEFEELQDNEKEKFIVQSLIDLCKNDDIQLTDAVRMHKGTSLEELVVLGDLHDVQ